MKNGMSGWRAGDCESGKKCRADEAKREKVYQTGVEILMMSGEGGTGMSHKVTKTMSRWPSCHIKSQESHIEMLCLDDVKETLWVKSWWRFRAMLSDFLLSSVPSLSVRGTCIGTFGAQHRPRAAKVHGRKKRCGMQGKKVYLR